jgi:hypothetical protein
LILLREKKRIYRQKRVSFSLKYFEVCFPFSAYAVNGYGCWFVPFFHWACYRRMFAGSSPFISSPIFAVCCVYCPSSHLGPAPTMGPGWILHFNNPVWGVPVLPHGYSYTFLFYFYLSQFLVFSLLQCSKNFPLFLISLVLLSSFIVFIKFTYQCCYKRKWEFDNIFILQIFMRQ